MRVVVGLGNPGEEYKNTRHNVGFEVVDRLREQFLKSKTKIQDDKSKFKKSSKFNAEVCEIGNLLFVKPQTFMNRSGEAVAKIVLFYKIGLEDLWVVHDDLDLELGKYKMQNGVGPKVHMGVDSVNGRLGKRDYWRVRVGVDSRTDEQQKIAGRDYVLMKLSGPEQEQIGNVVDEIVSELVKRLEN